MISCATDIRISSVRLNQFQVYTAAPFVSGCYYYRDANIIRNYSDFQQLSDRLTYKLWHLMRILIESIDIISNFDLFEFVGVQNSYQRFSTSFSLARRAVLITIVLYFSRYSTNLSKLDERVIFFLLCSWIVADFLLSAMQLWILR